MSEIQNRLVLVVVTIPVEAQCFSGSENGLNGFNPNWFVI